MYAHNLGMPAIICFDVLKKFLDRIYLSDTQGLIKYYFGNYHNNYGRKLIILYIDRNDQLIGEEHLRKYVGLELLSLKIMNYTLLHRVAKLAIIRKDNVSILMPTKRDINYIHKLTPILSDLGVILQDYILFSGDDHYSFKSDAGLIK